MQRIVDTNKKIPNITPLVKGIFDKIQAWKEKMGDLEEQEEIVLKKLRPVDKISIHNIKTITNKLEQLKHEIKLTDEDIAVISFSTIDHDYFIPMLVKQSDYLEWFTTNYAGENTVEDDLLEEVRTDWEACVSLAQQVINEYGKI